MKKRTTAPTADHAWLMAKDRTGVPRVQRLSWGRLARIYYARSTTKTVRDAIKREARRCGYRVDVILGFNRWD